MSRLRLIHHVNVSISDRERTRQWYEKVLGAEFLDRGAGSNRRQLQLRLGAGEIHFSETSNPTPTPSSHFPSRSTTGTA
jgi:catechol 2,3-dioxygenase-like lactoylglutathione lyase family enzyme